MCVYWTLFYVLGLFFVTLDTIPNSKMQKSLLLQFVIPKIINAMEYKLYLRDSIILGTSDDILLDL